MADHLGKDSPTPLLAAQSAQNAYAKQNIERHHYGLIDPHAFVRGIRHIGYRTSCEAIAELIDNSIQAFADRIDIIFGYGQNSEVKPTQIAVIDNGHGMSCDIMRLAMMWGGTHRENDRLGLGRFGYGLPCATMSLGRRFSIYSKADDGSIYAIALDLDALESGEYSDAGGKITIPMPCPANLPVFVLDHMGGHFPGEWKSGVVVVIEKLDRLDRTTRQGLKENFSRTFGTLYHKLLKIVDIFVDGTKVNPLDPLFLTPGGHLYDLDSDRAVGLDPITIDVPDTSTGDKIGEIHLRYSWLPPSFGSKDKTRDAVGLNANERFLFLKEYQGIIFSRNGRLIDLKSRTPWTTFINNDRYIKVEVEFSASLDELFGVTTSKQQITVSHVVWDLLREAGMTKAIEQLRLKVREAKAIRREGVIEPHRPIPTRPIAAIHDADPATIERKESSLGPGSGNGFSDDPFFWLDYSSSAVQIVINDRHPFAKTYCGAETPASTRQAVKMLIASLVASLSQDDLKKTVLSPQFIGVWGDHLAKTIAAI